MSPDSEGVLRLRQNAAVIQSRINAACARAGRDPAEIRLIWVSKNHPQERLLEALAAGARLFGENRVQEVLEKFPLPLDASNKSQGCELHLIGHLQRNKVRKVLPLRTTIHSVDSFDLWETTDRVAGELNLKRDVFLQINTSREPQKYGFPAQDFLKTLMSLSAVTHVRLLGLMTMGPADGDPEATRACFGELRGMLEMLKQHPGLSGRFPDAKFLSMGMSGDFEIAVEEGAHYLRIGTALFGERT